MPAITLTATTTDVLDLAGNAAATFTDQPVTNNVGVTGFEVNNDGDDLNINNATGAISFNPANDPFGGAPYTTDYLGNPLNVSMFDSVDAVCLVKIDIPTPGGGTGIGAQVAATPSLWLHPKDIHNGPVYQQKVAGVNVPALDANGLTHTVTANSQGKDLTITETFNGETVESDALTISGVIFTPEGVSANLWINGKDAGSLDQSDSGGTAVSANNDPVRRMVDQIEGVVFARSGGDNTWDAVNQQINVNGTSLSEMIAQSDIAAISGMPTAGELWITLKTSDDAGMVLATGNASRFAMVLDDVSTAGHTSGLGSTGTVVIDQGLVSENITQRRQLFAAVNVGRGVIIRMTGFNATNLTNAVRLFNYSSVGNELEAKFGELAITPALTSQQAADLTTYFNGRLPQ